MINAGVGYSNAPVDFVLRGPDNKGLTGQGASYR